METTEVADTDSAPALENTEQPEIESSADSAQSQPDRDTTQADAEQTEQQDSQRGGVKARIGKLVQSRNEAEQEAARLKQEIAELKAWKESQSAQKQPEKVESPKPDDFDSFDDYIEAKARHAAETAASGVLSKAEKERQEQAQRQSVETEHRQRITQFQTGVESLAAELPDVDDVLKATQINPNGIGQALLRTEKGPDVLYYLGNHPAELNAIQARIGNDYGAALMEVARLEGKASEFIKSRRTSKAPTQSQPITPGGRRNDPDPAKATSMEEYVARRRKQRFGK